MEKKTGYGIYCCIFFVLLWIPLLGMFFYQDREVDRKEALSPFPHIRTEQGTLNRWFLPELGEFFSDHFAFRWEIIEADFLLMEKIFRMSGDDGVIQGRDGYYFYADTLIFEIVERHLDILAREALRMPAPRRDYQEWGQEEIEEVSMEVGETDGYTKVSGLIPRKDLDVDSEIYVRCVSADQTIVYEASPLVLDPQKEAYGYGMYISNGDPEPGTYIMEVLVRKHGKWVTSGYVGSFSQG